MKYAQNLLKAIRERMGGHVYWRGMRASLRSFPRKRWAVVCGSRRYEPGSDDAAIANCSGAALNFQISGTGDTVERFEICVGWPAPAEWLLMFHLDPDHDQWPDHPLCHMQFAPPRMWGEPPFVSWRIPMGETQPERILEFVVANLIGRVPQASEDAAQP